MNTDEPKFDSRMSRSPFEIPDGYFDDFSSRMDSLIDAEVAGAQKSETPVRGRSFDLRRWVIAVSSSAAVIAAVVFGGYSIAHMQRGVEQQAEQILARDAYDEIVDMIDIDHIEDVLADYADYDD